MNLLRVFLCFAFYSVATAVIQELIKDEGYYWRDYKGKISRDALPGGKDKQGRTTYIGQALHIQPINGKLFPGPINPAEGKVPYVYGGVQYQATKNIKILCSRYQENFEWIATDVVKAKKISEDDLVLGGYDLDYPFFIGRTTKDGELATGFVALVGQWAGLHYISGGQSYLERDSFEILAYRVKTSESTACSATKIVNINVY